MYLEDIMQSDINQLQKDKWGDSTCVRHLKQCRDLPGGPVVKNLPCNTGDPGSIPGQGTKVPQATGQLSPEATQKRPIMIQGRSQVPHLRPNTAKENK